MAATQTEQAALGKRRDREHFALLARELDVEGARRDPVRARFIRPEREAGNAHTQAAAAREEVEELRTLAPAEAAALIETKRASAAQARQFPDERARLCGTSDRSGTHAEPN